MPPSQLTMRRSLGTFKFQFMTPTETLIFVYLAFCEFIVFVFFLLADLALILFLHPFFD
jgi:hypothetical protein